MLYRFLSAVVAVLLVAAPAWGATFEVDTPQDVADASPGDGVCASSEGACGLRGALEEANALPGEDTILLPEGEFAPAAGAPTLLRVEDALTLAGAGLDRSVLRSFEIVVASNLVGARGPFLFRDFSLLESAGTEAAITLLAELVDTHFERVRLAGGAGQGVRCWAEFDIPVFDQVVVEENAQTGISCVGGAVVRDSWVRNNGTMPPSSPLITNAGISVDEEELILERSVVSGNSGGGVSWNQDASLIRDSLIEDNGGPGLFDGQNAFAYVIDTIVRRNRGGGIRAGNVRVFRSAIHDNESAECGGGVFLGAGGQIVATTVSGNAAPLGGGLCHQMDPNLPFEGLLVLGSTITGNQAAVAGGGIAILTIGDWQGPLRLHESIVAGNEAAVSPDCAAPLVPPPFSIGNPPTLESEGGNLIGDASGCEVSPAPGDQLGNAASPLDPRLGPLADNGGPTPTHALLEGSPALDAIAPGDCDMTSFEIDPDGMPSFFLAHDTDQRGVVRPQGPACDVGAFERVEPLAVEIDVRPFQRTNRIHLRSRGWVAVALLGSAELDVSEVEAETLRFGAGGASAGLALPLRDWDRDGYDDLLALFRIQATGIEPGEHEACLSGQTAEGVPFEGCDDVSTWPPAAGAAAPSGGAAPGPPPS